MMLSTLADATRSRFKALGLHHSVQAAAATFADGALGLIVICDAQERAVGVISKSDLVRHLARAGSVHIPVTDVMTTSIISASPGDDLRATWRLMVQRHVQNLPLLDQKRRPVGTLDVRDALQAVLAFEEEQEGQLVNYIAGMGYR